MSASKMHFASSAAPWTLACVWLDVACAGHFVTETTERTLTGLAPASSALRGRRAPDREKDANRELALQPARVTQSCLWKPETAALFRAGSDLPSLSYLCWHFWSSQLLNTKTGSMQPNYSAQQLSGVLTESCLPLRPKIPPRSSPLCSKSRRHLWCILWWEGEQTLQSHFSNVT